MHVIKAMVRRARFIVDNLIEKIRMLRRQERSIEDRLKSAQQKAENLNKTRTVKKNNHEK